MVRIAAAASSPAPRRRWHKAFLAMLPQIVAHARVSFRHLNAESRAEAVQEVVCNALKAFVRLVELKKTDITYATALAKFGVRQVKDDRKVGGHLNVNDVMSPYCQRLKNAAVERLDHYDEDEQEWSQILLEDRTAGPADIVRTRLDFAAWLKQLPRRERKVVRFLSLGHRTVDAAKKFGVSQGRISQLRRELAESWRRFVGDDPVPEAA
jgi:DNA-directed RNA polymerase specialized sigma24 family protein